jgi:hypothetical protein
MTSAQVAHPTVDERRALGKQARTQAAPDGHTCWKPAPDRPDPVGLLKKQNATREADLVPVRHGRMMVSPFTFYRGTAKIMAADLKGTPTAGLQVQLCGDAHLSNFGAFASPERTLLFDLNDFDETLPGPFVYDVKRLAASFTVAARNNGFSKSDAGAVTTVSVSAYREAMAEFAGMGVLEIWYSRMSEEDFVAMGRAATTGSKQQKSILDRAQKGLAKARTRDSLHALSKLTEVIDGRYRIISAPPIVIPARDLPPEFGPADEIVDRINNQLRSYRARCKTIGGSCLSASGSSMWPSRSSAWVASEPGGSSAFSKAATRTIRCSCRSRKPPPRCWRTTCPRAGIPTTASGSSRASEECRPPATSSSAGPRE